MSNFEEIAAALHLRLLNSSEDAGQGNDPSLQMSNSLEDDAKCEASSLANPGKVWSSKGFKSFASSKNVNASSRLGSSWIRRLKTASHWTSLEESHDMKDMCIDMKTSTHMANQCGTPTPVYENSRRSKQDFYSNPYSVITSDQYSRDLRAASSRSLEGAKVLKVPQLEVRVTPRFLPTVEALLPSYSQKVDARPFAIERGNLCTSTKRARFSNEVVLFSVDERPRVSCSSIKGVDFTSAFPSPGHLAVGQSLRTGKGMSQQMLGQCSTMSTRASTNCGTEYSFSSKSGSARNPRGEVEAAASERRHSSTLGSKYDCEFDKEYRTEKSIIGASSIRHKFSFDEKGTEESMTDHACKDNTVLMNYKAMSEEIKAGDFSCYQMHALDADELCESHRKQPGICLPFSFHVAEDALSCPSEYVGGERASRSIRNPTLSCQRLEQRSTNSTEYSRQENGRSSFGTIKEAYNSESLDCRSPCPLLSDCEVTFESAQKRICGKGNVSLPKVVKEDFTSALLSKTNMGAGACADAGGHGVHCFAKRESGYKVQCSKEEETGHMHALQKQSDWSNWMGYESCVSGTVSAMEFPTKPNYGGLVQASGSYSDSCEKIEGGILSTLNEKTRLPAGHLLPPVLRKQSWDHDKQIAGPLSNVFCKETSLAKCKLWMQRWCTASPKQDSLSVNREFKTFVGISPFSEGGDGAKIGSIPFGSNNFAPRPAKRICHGSLHYTSKKGLSGFQTASQAIGYRENELSSHFMKRFFTPTAAAMAIVGTRQVHGTQPQRKGLFGMWVAAFNINYSPSSG